MTAPTAPAYSPADLRYGAQAPGGDRSGAVSPQGAGPTGPRWRIEPARRLEPARTGRAWRPILLTIAIAVVVLLVGGMAVTSCLNAEYRRGFSEVPAQVGLGAVTDIEVSTNTGSVRAMTTDAVDEVTVALVRRGLEVPPGPDATASARVQVRVEGSRAQVQIEQPVWARPVLWEDDARDVLVLVPTGTAGDLDLRTDLGGVEIRGDHRSIEATADMGGVSLQDGAIAERIIAHSDAGSIRLHPSSAPAGGIAASSDFGDIVVELPRDAAADVRARSDMGDVTVAAPGSLRFDVRATSDMGSVDIDPDVSAGSAPAAAVIDATTSMGDVAVSR